MPENDELPVLIYTTFETLADAEELGGLLVEEQLAACVNIYPEMVSIYRWEGKLEKGPEVGMFVKTRRGLAEAVMAAIRDGHPYDTPALLVIPTEGGSAEYCAWIAAMTRRA